MKKVMVIMGGLSSERDISLMSGQGVSRALKEAGYSVIDYVLTSDIQDLIQTINHEKPDVVFNALHGKYGEDGCIQGILELMHIPYTHSGVMGSAMGMDKDMTRCVARDLEICIPEGRLVSKTDVVNGNVLPMPYVVKPNDEGSSLGVFIIRTESDKERLLDSWTEDQRKMLMEKYIPGRELSAVVMDGQGVGVVEIVPQKGYYDFQNKYTEGAAQHLIPAPIEKNIYQQALQGAASIHNALKCQGVSRCDFRLDDETNKSHPKLYLLEINTNPGMTPVSLVPDVLQKCQGVSYQELVVHLTEEATCEK